MLEPNLADRTEGEVSNWEASAATGLSLAFLLSQWFSKLWTERVHWPSRQQQKWMRGRLLPHSFAYAGHCLPEVVTVPEQIRVFQCNFRGRFFQFGSTDSIPRDDMLSILIKKKKLYLLLKDFFCILSLWIQILCRLKPVLSYSLKWHDAGFQQLRIYPMAFRDSWELPFLHPHSPLLQYIFWTSGEFDRLRLNWKTFLVNKTAIDSKIRLNIDSPLLTAGWFIPTLFKWTLASTRE